MLFSKLFASWEGKQSQIKIQNITIIVLALAVMVMSFVAFSAFRAKRTVIIPSHINAAMEVSDIDASPNFLRINIVYALSLLYSYTPNSAADRFQEFLISFVETSKAKELRIQLSDRLRSIGAVKVAESLEVEHFVFQRKNSVLVRGKVYRYTLGQPIAVDPIYLKVTYRITDGNLKITAISSLTHGDYMRLERQQQIEGKKIEEGDKKRERAKSKRQKDAAKEKERLEQQGKASEEVQEEDDYEDDTNLDLAQEADEEPEAQEPPGEPENKL